MTTAISDAGFQFANGSVLSAAPRSYLSGLTLSTAGSSNTMSIAAGMGMDSTNAASLVLASAFSKTTGAWAVGTGNGGLDTGTIANSTWYYFYLINNPTSGVTDIVFSTSSSAPTLPSGYTLYRYIGGGLTNGSAQWTSFRQFGDDFVWSAPVLEFNGAGVATATIMTCTLPRGRKIRGLFRIAAGPGANTQGMLLSDPDLADNAPSFGTTTPLSQQGISSASYSGSTGDFPCYTNTSAQIRHREINTATVSIVTVGWTDLRGKDL